MGCESTGGNPLTAEGRATLRQQRCRLQQRGGLPSAFRRGFPPYAPAPHQKREALERRTRGDAWADTTTPHGRLMLTVLGGLAEFERELIRARTGEGRARAKARGVKLGRKPS